ncbi:hypothetical protein D3C72_1816280 [compost metagenome]
MAKEHEAKQGAEVAHAKHLCDQAVGERHSAQPQQAHGHRKDIGSNSGHRRQHEPQHDGRSHQVQQRQRVFAAHPAACPAAGIGAKHIGQRHQRQADTGLPRPQPLIQQIGRQMRGNEGELKATCQKTGIEQPEPLVAKGLPQCATHVQGRFCRLGWRRLPARR